MSHTILRLLVLVTGTLLITANFSAGTTLQIDFETLPDGSPVSAGTEITNQFTTWGVTFSSVKPPGASQATNVIDDLPTSSGYNFLAPGGPSPLNGGTLILDFSIPVTEVGSFFIDDHKTVMVTAYDTSLQVVSNVYSNGSPRGFDSWAISYLQGISRVEMVGGSLDNGMPDGWGIDDLYYLPTPEPTALLLLALGALGIAKRKVRSR